MENRLIAFWAVTLPSGDYVRVDHDDAPGLVGRSWHRRRVGNTSYAESYAKPKPILMHRMLTDAPRGMVVDHVNGDGLDNRRSNLRVCEQRHNCLNRAKQQNNKSGYRGVSMHSQTRKWVANISINKKRIYLGRFNSKIDAAIAYDEAAKKFHGEYARLNFDG